MRTARPVGLTDDGRFVIVETADGESISIPADDELRAALRNRPRRHLETELEQSMTPREIQMRIRAGASVDEIVEISGMPAQRVEAFAAPVLAERNHIAGLAQLASIRRAGEPTGHRTLRAAVNDRLKERGADPDTVEWDAFKMDDGRWSVSASYRVEQADRAAVFYFDQRGRFSVSGNDEARWVVGERTQAEASQARTAGRFDEIDTEPTLKLAGPADELALLRAIETNELPQEDAVEPPAPEPEVETEAEDAPDPEPDLEVEPEREAEDEAEPQAAVEYELHYQADVVVREESAQAAIPDEPSQLDLLYDLLGGDGYTEDSIRVFEGLSDATAVPSVADGSWQHTEEPEELGQPVPAEAVQDPDQPDDLVEAEQADAADEPQADQPDEPQADEAKEAGASDAGGRDEPGLAATQESQARETVAVDSPPEQFADGATQDALPGAEPPAGADASPESETEVEKPATKPKKRKRAAVPSWDEIMFGSPGPKGK